MMKLFRHILTIACALLLGIPPVGTAAEPLCPKIVLAEVYGAVIYVETDGTADRYCITSKDVVPPEDHPDWRPLEGSRFTAFKMDGTYYIRVMGNGGAVSDSVQVTVTSSYRYGLEAENVKPLDMPVSDLLEQNGDSIGAFNEELAKSAVSAGLYTPAAVASVCMTLLTRLSGYGVTLSYQPSGNYTGKTDWGISPAWGTKMNKREKDSAGTYDRYSMNCGTIIVWAYKQAGLNLNSTGVREGIFDSGLNRHREDNRTDLNNGDTGDIIATGTGHTMLVLDRVDTDGDGLSDSYLVFEMESPYLKLKVRSLHSIRLCRMYDMSALFSDTGALRKYARYWEGSFYIFGSVLPDYYASAYTEDLPSFAIRQALCGMGNPL